MSATYAQLSLGGNNDKETVKQLQKLLNQNGASLQTDGIFGPKTDAAVRNYQSAQGLQVDGIVGPKTWGALLKTPDAEDTALSTPAQQAKQALDAHAANGPGDFVFGEQALLDMAQQAYRDREAFAYDPNADAMYRYYKDSHTAQGRKAMEDTMGVAMAKTGGYSNTYAQLVGQQAYGEHLEKLGDVSQKLYELAYEKYTDETDRLKKDYETLAKKREEAEADHQALEKAHNTQQEELYDKYKDALSRQDKEYTRLSALLKLGYEPTDAELAAAGMTRAMARLIAAS